MRGQLRAKRGETITVDADTKLTSRQIVNAVRADPSYGSNSPLLAAMNYVIDSQRKSGLTKKSNGNGNGTGTTPAEPAA